MIACHPNLRVPNRSRESGVVLFLGLMLLLMLTLIGSIHFQDAIMQGRLAGNYGDLTHAFESSEAGGRWGSSWLQSRGGDPVQRPWPCSSGCDESSVVFTVGQYPTDPHPGQDFWSSARGYGIDPGTDTDLEIRYPTVSEQPRFVLEQQYFMVDDLAGDPQKGVAYYRVTALGTGQRPSNDAVVRSVVAKRFE